MAVTLKGYTANYLGLSTDAKPTEADDNAIFRELDTGKRYYFTGATWAEIPSSGGGGGGNVTSVNGKTGAVVLGASDVGAYTTAETDTLLGGKADKVSGASAGDLAGVDSNGNLTDSGINSAVIPSTASTSNKLSTAADTANEDITATANSDDIALTDSTDARVHDLKIYGKTEDGHSVGENGLTVTATGKNLIDLSGNSSYEKNGLLFTKKDNIITVTGTASEMTTWIIKTADLSAYNGCILSGAPSGGAINNKWAISLELNQAPWTSCALDQGDGDLINIPEGTTSHILFIRVWPSAGSNINLEFKVMIRNANDTSSVFEPYHEPSTINITSALPLRRKMLTVDLGDFNWNYGREAHTYESGTAFSRFASATEALGMFDPTQWTQQGYDAYLLANESCSSRYTVSNSPGGHDPITDKTIIMARSGQIFVIDNSYTDTAEFKAAVTGITLTYPSYCDEIDLADGVAITRIDSNGDVLATPVTTPLSDAEKAAFAEFRTFDGNTNVTATDDPFMSLTYVKNTDNGKANANVDDIAALRMAMIAAPYDDTATYAVGDYCTYGNKLWKCNTAIGTAEPFTAAHWAATTVMAEI